MSPGQLACALFLSCFASSSCLFVFILFFFRIDMFSDQIAVGMHTKESLRLKLNRCERERERGDSDRGRKNGRNITHMQQCAILGKQKLSRFLVTTLPTRKVKSVLYSSIIVSHVRLAKPEIETILIRTCKPMFGPHVYLTAPSAAGVRKTRSCSCRCLRRHSAVCQHTLCLSTPL